MVQDRKPLDANARRLAGVLFLDEPLTGYFALAALLVAGGIVLVNLRR